jgi:flagellin
MRIQHNIMAMNAYRNYNNNTSALSSNLEKLSSGYKINRAGDDAAGLAISEKMRAQISGLDQAQSNVKDGISLVKTGEGALQEVQDMLNRMVTLATQSANGTYDDETDRAQLQKEVDSLTEEIDRIADSANFNGISLLDGSLTEAATVAEPTALDNIVYDSMSNEKIQKLMLDKSTSQDPTDANDGVGKGTILETSSSDSVPSFTVNLDGVKYGTIDAAGADKLTLKIDSQTTLVSDAIGGAAGDILEAKDIAKLFDGKQVTTTDNITYTAKDNGDGTLTFTADAALTSGNSIPKYDLSLITDQAVTGSAHVAASNRTQSVTYTAGVLDSGGDVAGVAGTNSSVTLKLKDAEGNDMTFTTAANLAYTATAAQVATALNDATDAQGNKLSDYFTVAEDAGTAGKLVFTSAKTGTDANTWEIDDLTFNAGDTYKATTSNGTTNLNGDAVAPGGTVNADIVDGKDAYDKGVNGYVHYGTDNDVTTTTAKPDQLASTTLDLSTVLKDVADGTKITLGDESYTFAVGKDSIFAGQEGAIVLTEDEAKDADLVASKLTQAAKNNETFSVGHVGGGSITLKQLSTAKDSTEMSTMEEFANYIGIETVNTTASADALAKAQSDAADAAAAEEGKSPLMLQIGDTSESYNQLSVTIEDMHAAALGIDKISIADQDSASAAIDVIKKAINQVSSTRGTLGATQNRLEHTQNNLSVMSENIQDAESTIRDTDIAEEMMSYTKNNILVQSAQAMLAQANSVPQGVLQLLQ